MCEIGADGLCVCVPVDCCVNRVCMCFSTKGMCTVAQDEIVIILQCLPDEKTVPRDIFVHLFNVYDSAAKGTAKGTATQLVSVELYQYRHVFVTLTGLVIISILFH